MNSRSNQRGPCLGAGGRDKPALAGAEQDLAWESTLILLLSELETFQRRLLDLRAGDAPATPVLEVMCAMVQHLVGFAERRLQGRNHGEALAELRRRAERFWADAGDLIQQMPRPRLFSWARLLGGWDSSERRDLSPAAVARRQLFNQVVKELLEVHESYFALFTACFQAPSEAYSWTSTCEVFINDMKILPLA